VLPSTVHSDVPNRRRRKLVRTTVSASAPAVRVYLGSHFAQQQHRIADQAQSFSIASFRCRIMFTLYHTKRLSLGDSHFLQSASILQKLAFGVGQLGFEIDLRRAPTIHYLLLYLKLDFRNIYI
jgi:hypothetical protein